MTVNQEASKLVAVNTTLAYCPIFAISDSTLS